MNELIKFPNLQYVLQEYIKEVKREYENKLLDNDHIASWNLVNNIEIVTHFQGQDYWVGLNLEDYWKYIEYGTRPHFPPPNKILEWIKIKPVLPYPNKNGKLPTPNQLAYLIGRKISEVGTKGTKDLTESNLTISQRYEELIKMAIDEDVTNEIDGVLKIIYVN